MALSRVRLGLGGMTREQLDALVMYLLVVFIGARLFYPADHGYICGVIRRSCTKR